MENFSLPMVLKIREHLDNNDVEYSFNYDEDEATFKLVSSENLTGESIISIVTVLRDDDDDDCVFVKSMIAVDYDSDPDSADALRAIAAYANEHSCGVREYGCEMYVEENDEGAVNIFLRARHDFNEDIFDDEDDLIVFINNVIGGPITEFSLIYPLIAKAFDGEEKYEELVGKLQQQLNVAKAQVEGHDEEDEYVDYQENLRNSVYELLESDDFDSLLENTLQRAEAGDAEAQYMLGKIYQCLGDDYEDEDDDDFDKDESAFYWFAKAAKQGFGLAMFEVAEEYRRGNVVEIDGDASITWYKMTIEALKDSDEGMKKQAVTDAYLSLALLHEIDLTTEQDGHTIDKKAAFNYMLESAKRGSFVACARVADYYRDGSGTSQDDSQAQIWYEKTIELIKAYGVNNKDLLKHCNTEIEKLKTQQHSKTNIVFPVTYGKTKFESMDDVVRQKGTNPDALGFYAHCCIFGNGVKKNVGTGVEGLFAAANAGSTDAILSLGRLYEYGYEFMRQNLDAAVTLYKYAYSLKNIDALHSLGLILFTSFDKKEIGLSMMRKAAELGSKNASIQLELIQEDTQNVDAMLFDEIPKKEFQYDEFALADHLQLYGLDLEDENAVKNAILEIMSSMPPETFSIIMNEFRTKYLRNRKFSTFHKTINFPAMFDALVADGLVETRKVDDYGATENTIYIAKGSTKKMTSHTLDWDV